MLYSPSANATGSRSGEGNHPYPSFTALQNVGVGAAVQHSLQMISQREADVRAWAHLATASDLPEADSLTGPLAGVPFAVKDVINVAGMPTRCGSPATETSAVPFNAACVELLVRAGAVPVGKAVTAEFAFRHPGPTRNPRNLAHTPGGSSSGSAAAVAAGMVPLALSTQTGGSIIRPAAYCGVPGFKPSYGFVSRDGLQLTSESLDTIGWHTSDMDWMLRAAEVLLPAGPRSNALSLQGAVVAVIDHAPELALEEEGRDTLELVVQRLEQAGARCMRVDAREHLQALVRAHTAIMKYEFARNLEPVVAVRKKSLSASLLQNVQEGWATDAGLYLEMCAYQHEMRTQWKVLSGGADFILTPPASGPAPAGHEFTGTPAFNKTWTVLGWPCLHLPVRINGAGLPTGVQLVGPWKQDFDLLSYGALLEHLLDN